MSDNGHLERLREMRGTLAAYAESAKGAARAGMERDIAALDFAISLPARRPVAAASRAHLARYREAYQECENNEDDKFSPEKRGLEAVFALIAATDPTP